MVRNDYKDIVISPLLVEKIRSFPLVREINHCGRQFLISPFDIYAVCPLCQAKIKVRAFSASTEIEDIFDAVFEWMMQPNAISLVNQRQEAIKED